jgi:di- and tripeptidase
VLSKCVFSSLCFGEINADASQKYNSQYERVSRFQAHNGRILASAFSKHGPQNFYITGGNDDTITVWDIKSCIQGSDVPTRTSNGELCVRLDENTH